MFKLKKIITKKTILFIAIILVMGVMFLIYQKQRDDKIDDISVGIDKDISSPSKTSAESDSQDLDTSIFIDPKFMYLKDNKYKDDQVEEIEAGKPNPFEGPDVPED